MGLGEEERDVHVRCPTCNKRVYMRTMLDVNKIDLAGNLDETVWGKPTDNRVILKRCLRGKWMHIKVNNQHRLLYLRGNKK